MSSQPETTQPWPPQKVVVATLAVSSVAFGFLVLYGLRWPIVLLFTALVMATAMRPMIEWLGRWGFSRTFASVLVHLLALTVLLGFLVGMAPMIIQQVAAFVAAAPEEYRELRQAGLESKSRIVQRMAGQLPAELGTVAFRPGDRAPLAGLPGVGTFLASVLGPLFVVLAIFLMSVYWSIEGDRVLRGILLVVPPEPRESAREVVRQIEEKLGAFVLGQSILCLSVGLMSLAAYWWIGLPYALALAFVAGLLEAVPNIGPILGTIPAILVAVTLGPGTVAWVIAAQVLISLCENNLLVPRVMDRSVGINPVATLLAIAAFLPVLGPLGGILAIPLAAIVQLLLDRYLFSTSPNGAVSDRRSRLAVLAYQTRQLQDDLSRQWRDMPPEPPRADIDGQEKELERIVAELAATLREAAGEESAGEGAS